MKRTPPLTRVSRLRTRAERPSRNTMGFTPLQAVTASSCTPSADGVQLRGCATHCDLDFQPSKCSLCECSACNSCTDPSRVDLAKLGMPCYSKISSAKDGTNSSMCENWCDDFTQCRSCKCKACRLCVAPPPPPAPPARPAPSPRPLKAGEKPAPAVKLCAKNATSSCHAACSPKNCDHCGCRGCPFCLVHKRKLPPAFKGGHNRGPFVGSVIDKCGWLPAMRNIRQINAFCFLFYGTDRSRCETAVTSSWPVGINTSSVCTEPSRCLWSRCMWVQIDPGRPGNCVGGEFFRCAREPMVSTHVLDGRTDRFTLVGRYAKHPAGVKASNESATLDGEDPVNTVLLDSILDG